MTIPLFLITFLLIFHRSLGQNEVLVNIDQGTVIGTRSLASGFYEFYGIPYADSTSGSHRFKAPTPPPNFEDDFIANRTNIKCVHATSNGYEGTEDCLVLDIVTPMKEDELLPVMVWVKGIEFDHDLEKSLSFTNLVAKDVLVVSINYRESILGFLCLGTESAPGNAGLKDIIAGLRWVQNNIMNFGGDPNTVTIFGHGSGAAAVDLVTLSPLAAGLVDRAIAQSGNSLAPWAISRQPLDHAILVAGVLGYDESDPDALSEIFTRTSLPDLMAAINELDLTDNSLAFAPCLENHYVPGEAFMTYSPYEILADRDYLQIPFIIGFVQNEGTMRAHEAIDHNWLTRMDNSFSDFIQQDLSFENEEEREEVAQEIRNFYFNDRSIDMTAIADYVSYHGDTMIFFSAIREALLRSVTSTSPVYIYQFSYEGPLGSPFVGPLSVDGAAHSEELAYLFNNGMTTAPGAWDTVVMNIMVERWTNFAKTGEPRSDITTNLWPPATPENLNFLHIFNKEGALTANDLEYVLIEPQPDVIRFWDDIYSEHFKDVESTWMDEDELDIEESERDDEIIVEEDAEDITDDPDVDVVTEEPDECDPDEDPDCDSASTAVGYTFLIVSLFYLLSEFHQKQLL